MCFRKIPLAAACSGDYRASSAWTIAIVRVSDGEGLDKGVKGQEREGNSGKTSAKWTLLLSTARAKWFF